MSEAQSWCYAHGGPQGSAGKFCICGRDWSRAPTSAAGATKPNELTSSPEPAPALRAAEWVETANRLTEELETAAILYGDSEPGSIDESNDQHRMSAAREAVRAHLSRASGLLPVAREGLSDEQIKERCKAAGIQWIEPMLDDEGDGYPGGFDMTSMEAMRALLAPASGDAPGEAK